MISDLRKTDFKYHVRGFPIGSVCLRRGSCRRHTFSSREDPLAEGVAAHSSILAWRIPWTEEPGGLQSMGSQRVGQD